MNESSEDIAVIFKALCHKNRVDIVRFLQSGEKCACKITEELDIPQSKLSYHMKILCESKIVESWYVGKWTHYKINEQGSKIAIDTLIQLTNIDEKIISCNDCKK